MPERCFVAIELPAPTLDALASVSDEMRMLAPAWSGEKWVRAELLHITVAFAGPIPDPEVDDRIERLREVAMRHSAFTLHLSGAKAVPSAHSARMVWAVLEAGPGPAAALRDDVMRALDLPSEAVPYRPHVTLVRARRPRSMPAGVLANAARELAEFGKTPVGSVSVRSITLLSSTLGPGGPTYRPLAVVPLTGRPGVVAAD